MYPRRSCLSGRRGWWLAFVLLAVSLQVVRLPAFVRLEAHIGAPPARLAHLLGDFSHRHVDSGAWALEEEAGNYTSWRYSVTYSCGPRCNGRAAVEVHEEPPAGTPEHGLTARRHNVHVRDSRCVYPNVLPWLQFCDESESEVEVSAAKGGSVVVERATAWCGLWRAVLGACEADLRAQLNARMRRLRGALHA